VADLEILNAELMLPHKHTFLPLGVGMVLAGAHKDAPRAES